MLSDLIEKKLLWDYRNEDTEMKVIGVINSDLLLDELVENESSIDITGNTIHIGTIDLPQPYFDDKDNRNKGFVLVKVLEFSCNYRDKAIIIKASNKMRYGLEEEAAPITYFGSDFVAEVVAVGPGVDELKVGDRVIPDCEYPDEPAPGVAPGVVTNEASKGWLRLHNKKLMKIGEEMSNDLAAGYSIGGQTSESMIRRAQVKKSDRVLVLSARSNTSLFITRGLLNRKIDTTILTTSDWSEDERNSVLGVNFQQMDKSAGKWLDKLGKFDVIFDPFFDLHLGQAVEHLNVGGRYITCGYKNQHETFREDTDNNIQNNLHSIMMTTMINNLSIIGNCIGTTEDLKNSVQHLDVKNPPFVVDAKYTAYEADNFLNKTYNTRGRFGKVIMSYLD